MESPSVDLLHCAALFHVHNGRQCNQVAQMNECQIFLPFHCSTAQLAFQYSIFVNLALAKKQMPTVLKMTLNLLKNVLYNNDELSQVLYLMLAGMALAVEWEENHNNLHSNVLELCMDLYVA